jgi:hypothetical protein
VTAILHNFAIAAMVVQLSILYAASAFAKLAGGLWQDGTAIYYVLRTGEFNLSPLAVWLWRYGPVLALFTYSTMLYQLLWPFLIWTKKLKLPMVLGAIAMHGAIAFFMGLTWFSLTMIAAEAIVFSDREYKRYYHWVLSTWAQWMNQTSIASIAQEQPSIDSPFVTGET